MQTVPIGEIERSGFGVLDAVLKEGPVHVVKDGRPCYVILEEAHYRELMEDVHEATVARVKESQEDMKAGRVRAVTVEDLAHQLGIEDFSDDVPADRDPSV